MMTDEVQKIRGELKTIDEWERRFSPKDITDEISADCCRLRRQELLRKLNELASKN
jgi:hypothetical protein